MDNTGYLLAANIVIWLGVGGYALFLALGQKSLERRLTQMEMLDDER